MPREPEQRKLAAGSNARRGADFRVDYHEIRYVSVSVAVANSSDAATDTRLEWKGAPKWRRWSVPICP